MELKECGGEKSFLRLENRIKRMQKQEEARKKKLKDEGIKQPTDVFNFINERLAGKTLNFKHFILK